MKKKMQSIAALARITFKEGVRDKALYGIFLFALLVMVFGFVILSLFMRDLGKVASDFMLSGIAFAGLLMTFFITPQLLTKDFEKKTVYVVLSRGFARSDYILGKYAGILLLITMAVLVLSFVATMGMLTARMIYGVYFTSFRMDSFLLAVLGEWLALVLLNGIVIFFASFSSSGFLTLLFSISIYIVGENIETVFRYLQTTKTEIFLSGPVHALIAGSRYLLPNMALFDLKAQSAHGIAISLSYMASIGLYALFYTGILLFLASFCFQRREIL